jgi:hypothetical protein
MSHPVEQLLEFLGRESRTEARDPSPDFATRGRDGF